MCTVFLTHGQRFVSSYDSYSEFNTENCTGSVIGFPESTQKFIYFNRFVDFPKEPCIYSRLCCSTDVQDAIHAPHINWETCSDGSVYSNGTVGFPGQDQSVASTLSVLPNVIEKSIRTVIVHGLAVSLVLRRV
jgi:carboxypeptidase D